MVEKLDTVVDYFKDSVESQHFRTDEPIEIQVAQAAGNPVYTETVFFVAASVDEALEETNQMLAGEEHVNESSVFISNEDGEVGGGFMKIDGGDIEDAIEQFESEYL